MASSSKKSFSVEKLNFETKHIDIKYHSIQNLTNARTIDLEYCSSKDMTADILTKPLPKPYFFKLRSDLTLVTVPTSEINQRC